MNKLNYLIEKARHLWKFTFVLVVYSLLTVSAQAQLANVPVTGFTNDLVANGVGDGTNGTTINTSTTGNMTGMVTQPTIGVDGVGYTFIDATYKWWTGSVAPACYLPTGGAIPSAITSGLTYQLQSYSAFNAMTIASNTYSGSVWPTTGTVSLTTPSSYTNLYVLYESVMNTAGPTITATVTFTDATTQVFSGNALVNWFTATGVAYTPSISRAQNVAAGAANACATGPYLFQMNLALSAGNYGKTVQSISFGWSTATGAAANTVDYFHVLAVGGLTPCSGTPTPGNTLSTANPACPSTNFTLSMQNGTGGGATYQWQSSPDGSSWTDISGATSPTRVATQTVTTWYQCVVTCGANTGTSTPIQVAMAIPLNGTYTINSAVVTGGANFQTFTALKDILNCVGVSGPVTVNVVAASGPYNEQIQFNVIPGMSATNTVTINGNGNTLTFGATLSTAPGTLVLNGTDYMTVNNLTVAGTGGTFALVCHLYNQADNNTFSNCTFNAPANGTATTQVPFSISGSATTVLTTGLSGNNNLVTGCTMFSGYYNAVFYGSSSGANTGNQLINSTLLDFYFYGAYSAYQNGLIISGNTIERPTRTTLSTFYGVYVTTGNLNVLVEKNKVRNPFGAAITNTSTAYGIYGITAATSGNEHKIYNNLVSDMKSGGIIYGIYATSYYKVYHNTVSLDETGSTSASTLYGLYCASVTSTDFRNNIISVTRGGTGTKYCFYWSSLPTTSNNNGVYLNATAGTNYYAYVGGTTYTSFATYQTAQSRDGASVVANPGFLNPLTYNYTPTQSLLNDIGTSLGVLTDITGASRSVSTPDPGAIEFSVGPCAGTPAPGNTVASSNPACANSTLTLSLQNPTLGTGVTYQWQTSPDGSTWTNVSGANSSTYSLSQTTATYYQCLVTCSAGPSTGISSPILVNQNPVSACYCIPTTTGGTTYYISNFATTLGVTNINNASAGSATGYQDYYATASMSAVQNTAVNFTMTIAGGSTYGKAMWVDWNQDGTFAAGEQVASSSSYVTSPISGSFTVPLTATPGTTRMRIIASFTPSNPSNPCANSGTGEYEDYAFDVIPLPNCVAPPVSVTSSMTVPGAVCGSGTKILTLTGISPASGLTYQWQESVSGTPGTFVNVTTGAGGTTNTYTTATLTSSMYYLCEVGCSFGGGSTLSSSTQVVVSIAPTLSVTPSTGTNVCSGSRVDLSATGANTYSWTVNPGVAGYPIVSLLIGLNNLPTVTSLPTATLSSNTATPPATVSTPVWTYTVTGTGLNGCTSTSVVVLNVIAATTPRGLTFSTSPSSVCLTGTPVTLTVNNSGSIGAGQWTYDWFDQTGTTLLQSQTNAGSTNNYTPATAFTNGDKKFIVKVSNSLCPASYATAQPSYFVGYIANKTTIDANCGDNGIVKIYPEGQNSFTTWYSNDFSTGLLNSGVSDNSYTSPTFTMFTGGACVLTPQVNSQNGTLLVRNPSAINTNNLQVDFNCTTNPMGFAFNILGGGAWAWSYAADVWQGTLTPGTGGFNAENGSGSGIKIACDGTNNGPINTPGIYLMYNCQTIDQGPLSAGVLAYVPGTYWLGLTNAPVSIVITEGGMLTMKYNNLVVFDHVQLPAAYLAANKSNWLHAFSARTGGTNLFNTMDDLNIRYNSYEYSVNSTNGTNGTWQSSNAFTGLSTGSYPTWVRDPSNTSCFSNVGTSVIGTSASPSSAITVAASGFSTTICVGSSTELTTDVSIPGATFLWESSSLIGGPYSTASGNSTSSNYTTGALLSNTYFRCTFTCPSASPITSTPILVTVNTGSISATNSPQTINCIGTASTLTATPGANTTCVWYAAASGGSPLASGNSYVVTPLTLPATYYVEPVTTLYTNHFDNGGVSVITNGLGTTSNSTGMATRFTTSASIRIDSIKVFPTTTGTLTVNLQNSASTTVIQSFTVAVTSTGNFINVPVNFSITGSGNYQLTTSGVTCAYYSSFTGTYASPYMFMGGVLSIVGGASTTTGATSTSVYGSAFNWSITTSCPAGLGARVPVTVTANPTYLVSVTPSSLPNFCPTTIQAVTASSLNPYSSYTWSPVTNLYSDAAATTPLTLTDNQATVYFKAPSAGSNVFTVSTAASGCTNTATASITVQTALPIATSATPSSVCSGSNVQLGAAVSSASAYCNATGGAGTYFMNNFSTTGGATNITNNSSGFSPGGYNFFNALSVTQAVGGSINWSASNFSVGTHGVAVFVDWNQNGLFTDAGDQMYSSGAYVTSATGLITVPAGALNGITRMRVVVDFLNTAPGSCDVATSHETEDYNFVVTGGLAPPVYTYDWSSNSTFLSATNISNPVAQAMTSTQTYSVQVTDPGTGCLNTSNVIVTVNPLPVPLASSTSPICAGASLSLFGSNQDPLQPSNNYLWTGPGGYNNVVQNPLINGTTVANSGYYVVAVTNSFGCTKSDSTLVDIVPPPALSILSQTNVSCNGGNDGAYIIVVTNDPNPGSTFYNFDGVVDTAGFYTGVIAGTYTVQVTDGIGCLNSIQVVITEPDLLTVTGGSNTPVCTGTSLNLTATPAGGTAPFTYSWTGPNGFASTLQNPTIGGVSALEAGQYDVTITDANGCTGSGSTVVAITNSPTATVSLGSSSSVCLGGNATVEIAFTGTGPWSYTLTGSGGPYTGTTSSNPESVSVTPAASGTQNYSVTTVSDANCPMGGTASGTATVFVSTSGPIGGVGTITSAANEACLNTVLLITTTPVSGQNIRYSWNTGSNSGVVLYSTSPGGPFVAPPFETVAPQVYAQFGSLGNSSGYNVCTFGTNGCGSTNNRCIWIRGTVSIPGAIVGSTVACPSTTLSYSCGSSVGATTYTWTLNGSTGAITSGQGTTNVQVTFPSGYTTGQLCVTASLACGGSSTSAPRCMTIANGTPLLGSMNGTFTVCPGATNVAFNVPASPGAASYTWTVPAGASITGGQGTNAITVTFGPTYVVGNICVYGTSTCGIQSLLRCRTVVSNKPNTPGNIVGASTGVCGQTITYSVAAVAGATSYTWSITGGASFTTANGSTSIDVLYPGGYTTGQLCVTANNGCGSSAPRCVTIKGTPANPGVITGPTTVCANDASVAYSIAAVAGATGYVWTLPAGATFVSGQGSVSIVIDYGVVGGTITVVASSPCGVSGTRTLTITMNCKLSSSTLPGATVNAYPNPVSTQLNVELDAIAAGTYSVELIDGLGRVIYATEMVATVGINNNTIDVATFAKGVYTLSVKNADRFAKQIRIAVQ